MNNNLLVISAATNTIDSLVPALESYDPPLDAEETSGWSLWRAHLSRMSPCPLFQGTVHVRTNPPARQHLRVTVAAQRMAWQFHHLSDWVGGRGRMRAFVCAFKGETRRWPEQERFVRPFFLQVWDHLRGHLADARRAWMGVALRAKTREYLQRRLARALRHYCRLRRVGRTRAARQVARRRVLRPFAAQLMTKVYDGTAGPGSLLLDLLYAPPRATRGDRAFGDVHRLVNAFVGGGYH